MPGEVCVIVGATSKWQADGISTLKDRSKDGKTPVDASALPLENQWGIGGGISFAFAKGGCQVALFSRKLENVEPLAKAIESTGGKAISVVCELADEKSVRKAFDEVRAKLGDPSILIYNAGYTSGGRSEVIIEELPIELLDDAHHAHTRGAVLCCKEVLPKMRENGKGTILFSTVPSGLKAGPKALPNAITRAGERALCMAITEEYRESNVHAAHCVLNLVADSPGTRRMDGNKVSDKAARIGVDPRLIGETYWQLHMQPPGLWTTGDIMLGRAPSAVPARL